MKNFLKFIVGLVLAFALIAGAVLVLVAAYQYKPENLVKINIPDPWKKAPQIKKNQEYSLLSWSIGYGSRNQNTDNFLEGGRGIRGKSRQTVSNNLEGIYAQIEKHAPDLILLQAVDHNSKRSYYYEQDVILGEALGTGIYTPNHKGFLPKPWPLSGRTDAGLASFCPFEVTSAVRHQLPNNYSWPARMYSMKHCLQIMRLPLENDDAELVVINLDLKRYDDDSKSQIKQLDLLYESLKSEQDRGNYVIAGGDYGQSLLPFSQLKYKSSNPHWEPALLDRAAIPEGFQLVYGDPDIPTSRLNHMPYNSSSPEIIHFLTDGFIVSSGVKIVSAESFDLEFEYSDHNPLQLIFSLE